MSDNLYYEDVEIGDDIGPVERSVNLEQVKTFIGIRSMGDGPNRFTSAEKAKAEGLDGPIVPGAMNIAIVSQLLTNWSPSVYLKRLDCVFRGMVPHDKPFTLSGIVTDKDVIDGSPQLECDVFMQNEEGVRMVIGNATIVLPSKES